ncbi:MAG: hypothetical protein AMXMBFR36_38660 [Acidobacteriota bacterium]
MPIPADLKEEMLRSHDEYRRLHDEHHECENRLAELAHKTLPDPEDEVEEKRLKIHKLALKDRMEELLREQRAAAPA